MCKQELYHDSWHVMAFVKLCVNFFCRTALLPLSHLLFYLELFSYCMFLFVNSLVVFQCCSFHLRIGLKWNWFMLLFITLQNYFNMVLVIMGGEKVFLHITRDSGSLVHHCISFFSIIVSTSIFLLSFLLDVSFGLGILIITDLVFLTHRLLM